MKRIVVYLASILLTFTFGVAAASFWNWNKYPVKNQQTRDSVLERCSTNQTDSTALTVISAPPASPNREVVFGGGRLKIIPDEVKLRSERLRYEIDVSYPQIVGTEDLHIWKLNQHIKELATEQYQWPLNPSKADLRYYREKWPEAFNTIDLDYEIRLATDSFLSIYFIGYSYGIGALIRSSTVS